MHYHENVDGYVYKPLYNNENMMLVVEYVKKMSQFV